MRCQFCDNPATIHLTEQVKTRKREVHLCERCARERNLLPDAPGPTINLKALLSLLATPFLGQAAATTTGETRCPACGLSHAAFKVEGRLGCARDYELFRATLEPIFDRVHRSRDHVGKTPARVRQAVRAARIAALREQMRAAVASEDYEAAAVARDAIRQLEAEGTTG